MKNNFLFKILAVFLAVLLWLYVTNQQNPISEATYSVPLEVKNLPPKLVVAEKLPSVTVRLMGRKHLLEKTTSKDIQAFLNLQNADVGENKLDVQVTVPKDTQLVSVTPAKGDIILTTITTQQISLKLTILNHPPEGYQALTKQLTPTQIVVSGPKNILEKVSKAVVEVDLSDQKKNYLQRLPVRIYDDEGNDISDWLKIKPDVAEVFIAIASPQPKKQLAVKPTFSGKLKAGKISQVLIDPELVTVSGTQDILNNLFVAETLPIDLSDKDATFTTEVLLNLPEGVSAYPTPKVRVQVEITK